MKLSIFDVYVPMEDQAQCLRMKQLCVDNGLPIHNHSFELGFEEVFGNNFYYSDDFKQFCLLFNSNKTQVTEADFINLLKEYKKTLEK